MSKRHSLMTRAPTQLKAARRHLRCSVWGNSITTSAVVSCARFNDRVKTSHGTLTPQHPFTTRLIAAADPTDHDLTYHQLAPHHYTIMSSRFAPKQNPVERRKGESVRWQTHMSTPELTFMAGAQRLR